MLPPDLRAAAKLILSCASLAAPPGFGEERFSLPVPHPLALETVWVRGKPGRRQRKMAAG